LTLPTNKTKIVCTIGPASESPMVLESMMRAGMNVARLNFSHGDFFSHKKIIESIRSASKATGRRIAIMGDLPGPKMRIGELAQEPIELQAGNTFTLTTEDIVGDSERVSVSFSPLPRVVASGTTLYLNDGFIELVVEKVEEKDVLCKVVVGGELRSRKGLNLPGIDLGITAFTDHDYECLKFAMEQGVEAVSQSFVESAADIVAVRDAAKALGYNPFIIAKIERSRALDRLEEIIEAADGIMIARGDLGVEIPIHEIAVIQKYVMHEANLKGKPVITATQMLESMTENKRPTRAESTDVANAILDGTDCVMLSGESAMGKYPVEAVGMLARIAAATEVRRPSYYAREALTAFGQEGSAEIGDLIALTVESALKRVSLAAVMVPTYSGTTARAVTRSRLPVWTVAISPLEKTCQQLQFSYGVYSVLKTVYPENWKAYARQWVKAQGVKGNMVFLTERPSPENPDVNSRIELLDLERG
jgi:pyruvate kinase